jgi:cobalamin biosynthetic protein CobC
MVAAAPGTQLLIELLPRLFPLRSVAVLSPTYNAHAPAWSRAGAAVRPVADVAELAAGQGAVVCNPNNPDGRRLAADRLIELAAMLAAKGGLLVVDEAFADFAEPGLSLAPLLPRPGVVVLRSFGKAYGLAGLRLGFALAEPAVAERIRAGLGPWPVSGAAVHVGRAALGDAAWRAETAGRLEADVARLDACLIGAGFRVVGGTPLFRLAQAGHAAATFDRLGRAGILVRAFDERGDWLRFGLPGAAAEWDRLGRALSTQRFP